MAWPWTSFASCRFVPLKGAVDSAELAEMQKAFEDLMALQRPMPCGIELTPIHASRHAACACVLVVLIDSEDWNLRLRKLSRQRSGSKLPMLNDC